ncbi:DUF808 domain-containing protein [soil metagenome]
MAGGSLLTLLDDITTLLDDVAAMTKVAAKKTAGVLGDDLALNAQQVTGVSAQRELPVVWAVCKGSFRNKLILVPAALLISAVAPWGVTVLLMIGGAFLCYEGFEKIAHRFIGGDHADAEPAIPADASADAVLALERDKIKGAIRTDFILSAEIIAITLGTVAEATFTNQVVVLSAIALVMTIGVYGFVAAIVKLDDLGLFLLVRTGDGVGVRAAHSIGRGVLVAAPWLMKGLSIAGTAAMFLVGGGILTHGIAPLHHGIEGVADRIGEWPTVGSILQGLVPTLINAGVGIVAGGVLVAAVILFKKLKHKD